MITKTHENSFTGTIPREFVQLTRLDSFTIEKNNVTGSVNETLCVSRVIRVLQSDCHESDLGQVEIQCSCRTLCCTPAGDSCEEIDHILV